MSELFEKLQNSLRHLKATQNIDIADFKGITMHGKTYPAHKKIIVIGSHPGSYKALYHIPMENGLTARGDVSGYSEKNSNRYDGIMKESHALDLLFPHTTIDYDVKSVNPTDENWGNINIEHLYSPIIAAQKTEHISSKGHKFNPENYTNENNTVTTVHDLLNDWSKRPHVGRKSQYSNGTSGMVRPMNSEDLKDFHKNYKRDTITPPNIIKVYDWRDFDSKDIQYDYNIKTEQLKQTSPGFKLSEES